MPCARASSSRILASIRLRSAVGSMAESWRAVSATFCCATAALWRVIKACLLRTAESYFDCRAAKSDLSWLTTCCWVANCAPMASPLRSKSFLRVSASRARSSRPRSTARRAFACHSLDCVRNLLTSASSSFSWAIISATCVRASVIASPMSRMICSSINSGSSALSRRALMFALRMVEIRSRMPTSLMPLSCSTRRRVDGGVHVMHTTDGTWVWQWCARWGRHAWVWA